MRGVEDFLKDNHQSMMDYIAIVSTPLSDGTILNGRDARTRHYRLHIANALRQRTKLMTSLDREAVPMLPHLIDIPKQLAIIVSAVVRNSRELVGHPQTCEDAVDAFHSKCFEVEEEALSRASRLVSKLIENGSIRTSSQNVLIEAGGEVPSPFMTTAFKAQEPKGANNRPSTAPSPMNFNLETPHNVENTQASPRINASPDTSVQRQWNDHIKAPSTDSLPKFVPDVSNIVRLAASEREDGNGRRKKGLFKGILKR